MTLSEVGLSAVDGTDRTIDATPPLRPRQASIPAYLTSFYSWAYLNRRNACLLDHNVVVTAILMGNHRRLRRAALSEVEPGHSVLQAAHVYGCLIPELARKLGPTGRLDVVDLVPLQAALCRRKLRSFRNARVRVADAAEPGGDIYDVVNCFFLLHEIPDERKHAVVDTLLTRVRPGGRAVFVDYHEPAPRHPLRGVFRRLFDRLEPFAESLWHHEVKEFASNAAAFRWEKQTMFGGVYQKTVAHRVEASQRIIGEPPGN